MGSSYWDIDGDRHPDPEEDMNGDGSWDALDCRGSAGPTTISFCACSDGGSSNSSCSDVGGNSSRVLASIRGTLHAPLHQIQMVVLLIKQIGRRDCVVCVGPIRSSISFVNDPHPDGALDDCY